MTLLASGMAHKEVYEALVRRRRGAGHPQRLGAELYKFAQHAPEPGRLQPHANAPCSARLVAATVLWLVAILIL